MAKQHKPTDNYTGVLATPMQVHRPRARILAQETRRVREGEAERKNLEQFAERVDALFKHYGVVSGDFVSLAMELAQAHVPGFRFREPGVRRQGRPSNIGTAEDIMDRVEQFREIIPLADKMGLKRACEITSERPGSRCYGVKPATLRKKVTDAKSAPAGDRSGFAFVLAQSAVDLGIVGTLLEDDTDAEDRADTEVK